MKLISSILMGLVFISVLAGCSSKKIVDAESTPPTISQEPLSLEAQGSDTSKIDGLYSVHFEYDKDQFTSNDLDLLKKNVSWIQAHPKLKVQIEGHCDDRGSTEYNLALGHRRAQMAFNYFLSSGVPKTQLTVVSYGKERPLDKEETEEAYSKNRRDNFVPVE